MAIQSKYHLGIEIDKLTNSIVNTISGDSFPTDVHPISKVDLKNITKKNGWIFNGQTNLNLPTDMYSSCQFATTLKLFKDFYLSATMTTTFIYIYWKVLRLI